MTTPHHAQPQSRGRDYLIGSALAVLLTAVPFWLVMTGALHDPRAAIAAIFVMAMAQIVVHVVYFLHLDTQSEGGWTLLAFIFTAVIVGITIVGSIWVMYHLDANMMPMPKMPDHAMGGMH